MRDLLNKTVLLLLPWFYGSFTWARPIDNSIIYSYDNFQKIQRLEEKFWVSIYYESASVGKEVFNDLPAYPATVDKALKALLENTELTFRKMQGNLAYPLTKVR